MLKRTLLVVFIISPMFAFANMSETECHELQLKVYEYADSANSKNMESIKKLYELSTKLTEECGYLMDQDVLKQRREYNYILFKKMNDQ